jgi:hypothetical protein
MNRLVCFFFGHDRVRMFFFDLISPRLVCRRCGKEFGEEEISRAIAKAEGAR